MIQLISPFTDKIYASKAKKVDAPSTPPKRVTKGESYADAAAEAKGKNGLPSATPRAQRQAVLSHDGDVPASPMRMTRSRSRARVDED